MINVIRTSFIFSMVLLMLSGCASMAPEYARPEAPVPAKWPSGPAYKENTAVQGSHSADEFKWQEFFTD